MRLGAAAVIASLLGGSLAVGQGRRESEAELSSVRKEIQALQQRIARETTRRDDGARALRASEVEIAAETRKLAEVSASVRDQEKARRDLKQESERANRRLSTEKDALARQVRSSYMAGREELFKLLLSQESPAALGRMLVYFDYYNKARAARVTAVAGELAKLSELDAASARVEAAAGTPVRAIHRGRVAFADWLQGLGLLVIVDHGGGYMSLYGHNEALLKESGDWVEPGEPIAQVGDTGGQARPGLYFEIRLNGEPVNPNAWMAKRSAAP